MAGLFEAIKNMRKFGVVNALRSAAQTPGGHLDQTMSNPNNVWVAGVQARRGNLPTPTGFGLNNYYDPSSGQYFNFQQPTPGVNTYGPVRPTNTPVNESTNKQSNMPTDNPGGNTGGNAADTGFLEFFNGDWYTDPSAYYDAINQEIDRQYNTSLDKANADTATQKSNFLQQVSDAINSLNTQANAGRRDINSYYSGLGDIYQSSQADRTNNFNTDVTQQLGQIENQKTQGVSTIEKGLMDYLDTISKTRQDALSKNYSDAASIADKLRTGGVGTYNTYNPSLGNYQTQDTSTLLSGLNNFINQKQITGRYKIPAGSKAPIYSYLNNQ